MSDTDSIRAAIVAKLAAIGTLGAIHDHEPYAAASSALVALYGGSQGLHGWFVRRIATAETSDSIGRLEVTHTWRIRGYMALKDGEKSELTFDAAIDAIRAAFRSDETLSGAVATTVVNGLAGVQLEDSGPVMFAGVLCHAANLKLVTRSYLYL